MCGIAGYFGTPSPQAASIVRSLLQAQVHRGPDGAGLAAGSWTSYAASPDALDFPGDTPRSAVLGHNWLAIMDPTPGSRQPMIRGPIQLAFNGEIYNYVELRQELVALGERFSTDGDTEVLLLLWRRFGPNCLARLRGMFAFALLDADGVLWLVRDPFGIKPLYWTRTAGGVYFASEIRGFHTSGLVPRRMRDSAVIANAAVGINQFGPEGTLYESINEIPPGALLRLDGGHRLEYYMRWPSLSTNLHGEEGIATLRDVFLDSVALHLRSRRRIASCLSGGLDSTNVVWAVQAHLRGELGDFKAFTINSGGAESSELELAKLVCQQGAIPHATFDINGPIAMEDALDMVIAYETPVHVIGPVNQYLLLRHIAADRATVVLDGQGGDEMISGYPWFVPVLLKAIAASGADPAAFRARFAERATLTPSTQALYESMFHNIPAWVAAFVAAPDFLGISLAELEQMPETQWYLGTNGEWDQFRDKSIRRADLQTLLRLEDRLGMWFGLECRVPFLDVEVNRVATQLHPALLLHDGYIKYPYRQIQPTLAASVRFNTVKRGFWETNADRYPWMRSVSRALCLESPTLRRLFPLLEDRIDSLEFAPRWRLVQLALLERCADRAGLAALLPNLQEQIQVQPLTGADVRR